MISIEYIAGLFDGEGHITCHVYSRYGNRKSGMSVCVGISNNFKDVLYKVQDFLNMGQVILNNKQTDIRSTTYCYHILNKNDVEKFLNLVKEYLIIKKEECLLALDMLQITKKFRRGIKIPKEKLITLVDMSIEMIKKRSERIGRHSLECDIQNKIKLKQDILKGGV